MRQESTPLGSYQHGTVSSLSLKCREVGFEMAIYWYRVAEDINSEEFARRTVTASDSTCPADGVSLGLMSTLLLIPEGFCAGAKPYRIAPDESVEDEILPMIPLNTGLT